MDKKNSNKFNRLWRFECYSTEAVIKVEDILEEQRAIFAREDAKNISDDVPSVFYIIGSQHRFMNLCKAIGEISLVEGGCLVK